MIDEDEAARWYEAARRATESLAGGVADALGSELAGSDRAMLRRLVQGGASTTDIQRLSELIRKAVARDDLVG